MSRRPFALANWKMAMGVSESTAFVDEFAPALGDAVRCVDVVICPPYTALHAVSLALTHAPIDLGAQNLHAGSGIAHTGAISAPLLADAGCKWVMLGHWEVRRRTGESDEDVNAKIRAGSQVGLRPIVFVGEADLERGYAKEALGRRLPLLFRTCEAEQIEKTVVVYEPEWGIGKGDPASPGEIDAGCTFIRDWIAQQYGTDVSNGVRIIYGGSVDPERAEDLLSSPSLDGLGAGRMGRDPLAFAGIVRTIAMAKGVA